MRKIAMFAAALTLTFAGFGCGRAPSAPVTAPAAKPSSQVPADTTGVEAAAADLIQIAEDEDSLLQGESNDAQEMGDDKDEVNAIVESSYDLR